MTEDIEYHWAFIAPLLTIRNARDCDLAVQHFNGLLDEVGTDESHPLYGLLDTLGTLIGIYEAGHERLPSADGHEVLLTGLSRSHPLEQQNEHNAGHRAGGQHDR